jgi:hypothetical protein
VSAPVTHRFAGLICPSPYLEMPRSEVAKIANGCGAASARFDLVPNTMWGLDISPACDCHDLDYHFKRVPRDMADAIFLANLVILISRASKWLLIPRLVRACSYYLGVRIGGEASYGS